jgi:CHASE2 domain-containing sensor protein
MQCAMENDAYVKSVIQGILVGGVLLALAGGIATTLFVVLAWTQFYALVVWVPVVFIAIFLFVTLALLQKDANARKSGDSE